MLTPLSPRTLGLPYEEWWPNQLRAVLEAAEAFGRGAKYVLLEAPPGSGKSGIAVGLANFMQEEALFLTATKDLQAQYQEMAGTPRVLGRSNFQCLVKPEVSAAYGQCVSNVPCRYAGVKGDAGCRYFDQLRLGVGTPQAVLNYALFLNHANLTGAFAGRGLVVCDEAHLLRQELTGYLEVSLPLSTLRARKLGPPDDGDVGTWIGWARRTVSEVSRKIRELKDAKQDAGLGDQEMFARPKDLAELTRLRDDLTRLTDGRQWVMRKGKFDVVFSPVWVEPYAQESLWRHGERFVLMSATLGDPTVLCQVLGLSKDKVAVIRVPSTFDRKRRPLYYCPAGRVTGRDLEQSVEVLAPKVDELLSEHPYEKGLLHTVSYSLAQELFKSSRFKDRMVLHDARSRGDALEDFRRSLRPLVLVSPSMSVGVDLPDEQLRFQGILKLPFPDRGDPLVQAQAATKLGKSLHIQDTAMTLAQAYGRIMRSPTDYGVSVLYDQNYGDWFKYAADKSLPRFFKEAVVYA